MPFRTHARRPRCVRRRCRSTASSRLLRSPTSAQPHRHVRIWEAAGTLHGPLPIRTDYGGWTSSPRRAHRCTRPSCARGTVAHRGDPALHQHAHRGCAGSACPGPARTLDTSSAHSAPRAAHRCVSTAASCRHRPPTAHGVVTGTRARCRRPSLPVAGRVRSAMVRGRRRSRDEWRAAGRAGQGDAGPCPSSTLSLNMPVRFGYVTPNSWGLDTPQQVIDLAVQAEQLGADSLWVATTCCTAASSPTASRIGSPTTIRW